MTKSIKYRFDEVMLRYVKELRIKTTTFGGYDRDDVYDKIKELISEARTVCQEVYDEAVKELQDKGVLNAPLDQAQIEGLLQDTVDMENRVKELEDTENRLNQKIKDLQAEIENYKEKDEQLKRANDILREARMEAEKIIIEGQEKGEQEVLLGRAKSRAEAEKAQKNLENLKNKSEELREYLKGGEQLQKQMQAYAESFTFERNNGEEA
ncbi:MAG: hypothetical protein GX777_05120 [Fastidiosipila sp.]|nr:hypothetical protein [Fastidiosipila sp.]